MKMRKDRRTEERTTREAEVIRQHRIAIGYSQHEAANLIGVELRQYQRLEYGERSISSASMKLGLSVCAILKIDPFKLVLDDQIGP